jgi:preprotein translocase subunit YajC
MNNYWIIAAAGDEIQSSPTGSENVTEQAESVTTTDGSNGTAKEEQTEQQPTSPFGNLMSFLPIVLIFVIIYFMLFRGPKKKQQQHQKMISNLQKNDKVRTIGGIFGTILDVKDNEITIKIDEANNTKIKVVPGAISSVVGSETD